MANKKIVVTKKHSLNILLLAMVERRIQCMRKRCSVGKRKYVYMVTFGVGLLVASFAPPRCVIAVLAVAVIWLGIICSKC